jgi:mRNA degradation ribonuclease J1/J2
MKENADRMDFLKLETTKKFNQATSSPANMEFIREEVQAYLEEIIHKKTGRQPMVLPLVIEV